MIEIESRLRELKTTGLHRRTRLISGPQGPHVLLDGKPVLVLCSNNYLGLADHPRVRAAAADAAMRWGVGACASRLESGTMIIHRRLEERLAEFANRESALLFGSGFLANAGAIAALARPGDVVFAELPKPGAKIEAGKSFGTVESVKAVSEIYAPVGGEVIEANTELQNTPEKINTDPHGAAWLIRVRLANTANLSGLMDAAAYKAYIASKGKEASA